MKRKECVRTFAHFPTLIQPFSGKPQSSDSSFPARLLKREILASTGYKNVPRKEFNFYHIKHLTTTILQSTNTNNVSTPNKSNKHNLWNVFFFQSGKFGVCQKKVWHWSDKITIIRIFLICIYISHRIYIRNTSMKEN